MADIDLSEYYGVRDALLTRLEKDLCGPMSELEELHELPSSFYSLGILYPKKSGSIDKNEDKGDGDIDRDEPDALDVPITFANLMLPSSMGITFSVAENPNVKIIICVRAARYETEQKESEGGTAHTVWKRIPIVADNVPLELTDVGSGKKELKQGGVPIDGLVLYYRIRKASDGSIPVTLVLLNDNEIGPSANLERRDALSFFQVGLVVHPERSEGFFVERKQLNYNAKDEDLSSYKLIYRHIKEYGIGHGCSVGWKEAETGNGAVSIWSDVMPRYALNLSDSNPEIDDSGLAFKFLSEGRKDEIISVLEDLCNGYSDWIDKKRCEVESGAFSDENKNTATVHLDACTESLSRMRSGITLLSTDNDSWESFRLMNLAMLKQQARAAWIRNGCETEAPAEDDSFRWYPFQLAFILMCVRGIVEPAADERKIVDLLWFPTGGGKTEAYLGLIAFTIMLRRLKGRGGGVTAIMRYTLRLLTIQQFQRAAAMICACESIRRRERQLGEEPISIGLWVGKGSTPNTIDEAREALDKIQKNIRVEKTNPVQLHVCPWCGKHIDGKSNYVMGDKPARLIISCNNGKCEFGDNSAGPIPAYVIDDDIYRYKPSLIIATVDKFAQMPWSEKPLALFNARGKAGGAPPELIVQDELHLISGPLGTLTGLYETIIDGCSTDGENIPKVIASTATIRRAEEQSKALFNRRIRQFPSPGIDARDSYFAIEASPQRKGNRLYLGVLAPGKSHATIMIRVYAALMQGIYEMTDSSESARDPYWTMVGYFNSLRVLGGAKVQVQDDVTERIKQLANREDNPLRAADEPARKIEKTIELTSNEPSSNIPRHLQALEVPLTSNPDVNGDPVDVVFATNMISVGVDINRLGLMAVMGQPPSTSEYIQATSRVGRKKPGLVVIIYNAAKSRDRSHYESFVKYHSALYRQVEATSVTPFSARARDRGLHAVLISLVRAKVPLMRSNESAGNIVDNMGEVEKVVDEIVARIRTVSPEDAEPARKEMESILDSWASSAIAAENQRRTLVYENRSKNPDKIALLHAADGDADTSLDGFPTLNSLRDVDKEANLYICFEG